MDQRQIFLTILGMALVTFVPRFLPLLVLSNRSLPPLLSRWLRFVPVALLAAMLLPSLTVQAPPERLGPASLFVWAAFPTAVAAWKKGSLVGAVTAGVGTVALARLLLSA
jgi:branched-subunit amino acid transport protein